MPFEFGLRIASPSALYKFQQGATKWCFTNKSVNVDFGGDTYVPAVVSHGKIERTADVFRSEVDIELDRANEMALAFVPRGLGKVLSITIFRIVGGDVIVEWVGHVTSNKWSNERFVLTCNISQSGLSKPALPRKYQRMCPFALYSIGCGLSENSFATIGTVYSTNGIAVVCNAAASKPDGYFIGGRIKNLAGYQRLIIGHESNNLTLFSPLSELRDGDSVWIFAGCDHTPETCSGKFGNIENFGGQPWIPDRNPFDGGIL